MIPTQEDEEELPIITADMTEREKAEFYMTLEETHPCDPVVSLKTLHKSHDRFLFIDDNVYLLGTSIKDMGTSLCAITRLETSADIVMQLF